METSVKNGLMQTALAIAYVRRTKQVSDWEWALQEAALRQQSKKAASVPKPVATEKK
jgi:hypothetical protein